MSEMTLILKTPIEDVTPVVLEWNNEELLTAVKAALAPYNATDYAMISTEDIKHDRATLNRFIKALNEERIRIGRVYTAPLERFKSEVDEVLAAVREATGKMDTEVKARDTERREKKRSEIISYFLEAAADFPQMCYHSIEPPEWLNATCKMADIKKAIDGIVREARTAYIAIDGMDIDDTGKHILKNIYCRTRDLSSALEEYDAVCAGLPKQSVCIPEEPKEDEERIEIAFRVSATKAQLVALKQFLVDNKITYEKA
jgi:predicted GNAT family N-acyltransferase